MHQKTAKISSIAEAIDYYRTKFAAHPERDAAAAFIATMAGKRRKYPVIYLAYLITPDDRDKPVDEFELPNVEMPNGPEADLAREIVGLLAPLKMLNPVMGALPLGRGTCTYIASFGIPLNAELDYTPSFHLSLDQALAMPPPDPDTAGLMSEMHRRIDLIREHVPVESGIKIALPDVQGPFNIAHSVLGEDALIGAYTEPEKLAAFLDRAATFWIGAGRNLVRWIGPERLSPEALPLKISECSVNLISPEMYIDHVLPHDLKLQKAFGELAIHPCSGPHVFHATLNNIPNVRRTEAGFIAKTAAGAISVDEALATIGNRPIALAIAQELPEGKEEEFIRGDLDRYADNPRLLFAYTGMHWRIKDRPKIRAIHRRLDDYWKGKYGE